MSMSKKDFIALADSIRHHNKLAEGYCQSVEGVETWLKAHSVTVVPSEFTDDQILAMAHFCRGQNPAFNEDRWLDYIAGKCGPSGGSIK